MSRLFALDATWENYLLSILQSTHLQPDFDSLGAAFIGVIVATAQVSLFSLLNFALIMNLLRSLYGGQDFLQSFCCGITTTLYLVSAVQAVYYFRHQTDKWPIKLMVSIPDFFDITYTNNISCFTI